MLPPGENLPDKLAASLKEVYNSSFFRVLLVFGVVILLLALLAIDFLPAAGAGIEAGKPSPKTIKAPQTVRVIDYQRTRVLRRQAAADVQAVYRSDPQAAVKANADVADLYRRLTVIVGDANLSAEAKQQNIKSLLPGDYSPGEIAKIAAVPAGQIPIYQEKTSELLASAMNEKIKTGDLSAVRADIAKALPSPDFGPALNKMVAGLAASELRPNYAVDSAAMRKLIEGAVSRVKPVDMVKQKGETLVREGEVVSSDQLHTLRDLGLFRSFANTDISRLFGLAMAVIVLVLTGAVYLHEFQPKIYKNNRMLLLMSIILLVTVAIGKGISPFAPSYLIPAAAAAMLTTILLNPETGVVMAAITSLFLALVVGGEVEYLLVALLGSLAGVYLTAHISYRSDLTRAGFALMLVMGVLATTSSLLSGLAPFDVLINAGWGVIGGFFATMLTIAGTQFLEYAFNVTTDMKLLELANPTQSLLKDLMMTAPGTYNHSIITGNLAESAAEKVGANPLLTRVGAYYHDIGKIRRPFFFIENQYGNNPHDKTKPNLSCLIITAHVKEGVELAKQHHLPKEIIDIVNQHHGTGLVSYFYNRAKENEEKEEICEEDFRYPGEKPRSREAALVMLADASEAAARTITKPSPNRIEQLIKKIIQTKLQDGQLDQSDLTLGDLEIIAKLYAQTLVTMYHSRIEYPACEVPRQKKGVLTGSFIKQPVQRPHRAAGS